MMTMNDAGQMRRLRESGGRAFGIGLGDFGFNGGDVGCPSFIKQSALVGGELFALVGKADTAVIREFQHQGLVLEFSVLDLLSQCEDLCGVLLNEFSIMLSLI